VYSEYLCLMGKNPKIGRLSASNFSARLGASESAFFAFRGIWKGTWSSFSKCLLRATRTCEMWGFSHYCLPGSIGDPKCVAKELVVLWVKGFQASCLTEKLRATPDAKAYLHPGFCICIGDVYEFLGSEGISAFDSISSDSEKII
jgi:hypothetical protein